MAPFHMLRMLSPYPDERNVPLWGALLWVWLS